MSLNAQRQKVARMEQERKPKAAKVDWDNQGAVQAFNSFQQSLQKEQSKLAEMEKDAKQGNWDYDGGCDGDWDQRMEKERAELEYNSFVNTKI